MDKEKFWKTAVKNPSLSKLKSMAIAAPRAGGQSWGEVEGPTDRLRGLIAGNDIWWWPAYYANHDHAAAWLLKQSVDPDDRMVLFERSSRELGDSHDQPGRFGVWGSQKGINHPRMQDMLQEAGNTGNSGILARRARVALLTEQELAKPEFAYSRKDSSKGPAKEIYEFTLSNGIKYRLSAGSFAGEFDPETSKFGMRDTTSWNISFAMLATPDPHGPYYDLVEIYDDTKTGNAAELVNAVAACLRDLFQKHSVQRLSFSATSDSRDRVYQRMIKRLLPGWVFDGAYWVSPERYAKDREESRRASRTAILTPYEIEQQEVKPGVPEGWLYPVRDSDSVKTYQFTLANDEKYMLKAQAAERWDPEKGVWSADTRNWEISFARMNIHGRASYSDSKTGQVAELLNKVAACLKDLFGKNPIQTLAYTATSDSRDNVYQKMIQRLLPGWRKLENHPGGETVWASPNYKPDDEEPLEVVDNEIQLTPETGRTSRRNRVATAVDELEHLRTQLAGCGVAAKDGGTVQEARKGDYGWSPAYEDVLKLRREYDALKEGSNPRKAARTTKIELPYAFGPTADVRIYYDPTNNEIKALAESLGTSKLRGLATYSDTIVWDARKAIHQAVAEALDLEEYTEFYAWPDGSVTPMPGAPSIPPSLKKLMSGNPKTRRKVRNPAQAEWGDL